MPGRVFRIFVPSTHSRSEINEQIPGPSVANRHQVVIYINCIDCATLLVCVCVGDGIEISIYFVVCCEHANVSMVLGGFAFDEDRIRGREKNLTKNQHNWERC